MKCGWLLAVMCCREITGQDKQTDMTEIPNYPVNDPQQIIAELQRKLDERTAERDDSISQQTATADVLKVISRSAFDLQIVFETLIESAAQLCRADKAAILRLRDNKLHIVATHGTRSAGPIETWRSHPGVPILALRDMAWSLHVRYLVQSRRHLLAASLSSFEPFQTYVATPAPFITNWRHK